MMISLVILSFLQNGFVTIHSSEHSSTIKCLNTFIDKHFQTNSIVMYIHHEVFFPNREPNMAFTSLIRFQQNVPRTVILFKGTPRKHLYELPVYGNWIVFLDEFSDSSFILLKKFADAYGKVGCKFLLVFLHLEISDEELKEQWADEIYSWTRAVEVVVMLKRENEFHFYTYFPYECSPAVELIDIWNGSFLKGGDMYPDKLKPRVGKCLNIEINLESKIDPDVRDIGQFGTMNKLSSCREIVTMKLMEDICRRENYTPTYIFSDYDIDNQDIFHFRSYKLGITIIPIYSQSRLAYIVPARNAIPRWRNLIRPFTAGVWILIIITFISIAITLWFISKFIPSGEIHVKISLLEAFTQIYKICLLVGVTIPDHDFMRNYYTLILLSMLIVSTGYTSSIIKLLTTVQLEPEYADGFDLVSRGYEFQYLDSDWERVYTAITSSAPRDLFLLLSLHTTGMFHDLDDVYTSLLLREPFGVIGDLEFFTFFVQKNCIELKTGRLFAEIVDTQMQTIVSGLNIVKYNSAKLVNLFLRRGRQIFESGVLEKDRTLCLLKQSALIGNSTWDTLEILQPLSIYHLQSCFFVYLTGLLISFIVFFYESNKKPFISFCTKRFQVERIKVIKKQLERSIQQKI